MNDFSRLTLMFCLPRSRSQWWAWMFAHALGTTHSLHDPMKAFHSPRQFAHAMRAHLDKSTGRVFVADTASVLFHDQLLAMMPGVQKFYMIRNHKDVLNSLHKQTSYRHDRMINEQSALLFNRAYADNANIRVHWGVVTPDVVRSLWRMVTGKDAPDRRTLDAFLSHKVDVPVMEQDLGDVDAVRSLYAYRETLDSKP